MVWPFSRPSRSGLEVAQIETQACLSCVIAPPRVRERAMSDETSMTKGISSEDMRAYLGRESSFEGADEVSRNDIRRKLEVYCFHCPIHYEEEAAKAHGYRTVVAPNTMTSLWSMPAYWYPGEAMFYG